MLMRKDSQALGRIMDFLLPRTLREKKAVTELAAATERSLHFFLEQHRCVPRKAEADFMALGETLQSVHGDAGRMSRQLLEAIALLGSREDGLMADLRRLSEDSLRQLHEQRREIAGNLGIVGSISTRLGNLAVQIETLDRLGLYLGVVGLNIGVESTRSSEILEMFSGVAGEVRQLAVKIRTAAAEIANDCQQEQQEQQEIAAGVGDSLTSLAGLARDAEQAVREAVACITEIMDRSLAALAEANEHTGIIAEQVGRIVMGIQLHDSMSQRVDHIVKALTPMGENLRQLKHDAPAEQRLERLASCRQIIILQCGQIKWIINEVEEARHKSLLAFQAIDQRVEALARSFTLLQEVGSDSEGVKKADPLSALQEALQRLEQLLARGSAMVGRINQSARQTTSMAERLNGHMRSIEKIRINIHMKALNTIVMSARLGGHGMSMEVLAQETKSLSDQAQGFVGEVLSIHAAIADSVRKLHVEDSRDQAGSREALLAASTRNISETLARFQQESSASGGQAARLRAAIAEAGHGLRFLDELAAELSDHLGQLEKIAERITPWVGHIVSTGVAEEDSRLEALYSMDRERQLHAAIIGAGPGVSALQAANMAPAAPTGEGEILFFTDGKEEGETGVGTENDNVELF